MYNFEFFACKKKLVELEYFYMKPKTNISVYWNHAD